MHDLTAWLLEGPAWVAYRARLDLLGEDEQEPAVAAARQAMLTDPQVQSLVAELARWPGAILTSHKSAGHPLHKLVFLADLGVRADDPGMAPIVERILAHQDPCGPFQVSINVPKHFGGTGEDTWGWALCDAPLLLYALVRFGLGHDPRVRQGVEHLAGLLRPNGWPCEVSGELGKFRGPGRKDDPCPYTTLIMLKLLVHLPAWCEGEAVRTGAETLLRLWAERRAQHPYMFYMGTDFCKAKTPLVWYDIVHVLDVLSQVPGLQTDDRLLEMAGILRAKMQGVGLVTAESVWKAWEGWEFGQKREPSRWLTLVCHRSLTRLT